MIEPYKGVVYDSCCGSGGMFLQSLKFVNSHKGKRGNISIFGQESDSDTWRLCKMNLAIRCIAHNLGETPASTFTNDLHNDRKVDYVMSNPKNDNRGSMLISCLPLIAQSTATSVDVPAMPVIMSPSLLFMYQPFKGLLLQSGLYNTNGDTYGAQEDSKFYHDLIQRETFCSV